MVVHLYMGDVYQKRILKWRGHEIDLSYEEPPSVYEGELCKQLLEDMIELAILDVERFLEDKGFASSVAPEDFRSAFKMLFDPEWRINWGGKMFSLADVVEHIGVNSEVYNLNKRIPIQDIDLKLIENYTGWSTYERFKKLQQAFMAKAKG